MQVSLIFSCGGAAKVGPVMQWDICMHLAVPIQLRPDLGMRIMHCWLHRCLLCEVAGRRFTLSLYKISIEWHTVDRLGHPLLGSIAWIGTDGVMIPAG